MANHRYQGKYHYSVPEGWMNDPNGVVYYEGEYHLFYQSNPKVAKPKFVGWGHVSTTDFLHFKHHEEALRIEEPYENFGCWSGSALVRDGALHLLYTGNGNAIQQQCLARSNDHGETFVKDEGNPVLRSAMLPEHCDIHAWRDPYLFEVGNEIYVLTGARDTRGYGKVLTYKSHDFHDWSFVGEFIKSNMMADPGIFECPSFAFLPDGRSLFVSSVNFAKTKGTRFQNFATTIGMIGRFDPKTGKFSGKKKQELDAGFDYYAPQILKSPDGRLILIGWMQMWERNFPTQEDGWVGSMALPREVKIQGSKILLYPVHEILAAEKEKEKIPSLCAGQRISLPSSCHLSFDLEGTSSFSFFEDGVHRSVISFDVEKRLVAFSRGESGKKITSTSPLEEQCDTRLLEYRFQKKTHVDLFLDVSSAELFLDGGRAVMTGLLYPDPKEEYGFSVLEGTASNVVVKTIEA